MKNVIFGTGNYENVKFGNAVSITGDGGNAWGYFGPAYKKLAPRLVTYNNYADGLEELKKVKNDLELYIDLKSKIEEEYISSYYDTRLKALNISELMNILKDKFGDYIILLCHEPVNEFCHRRLIADYIEIKTGIYIPEVIAKDDMISELEPIDYKKILLKKMDY